MDPDIADALRYSPNLPSLSGVALRLVEIGRDPRAGIGDIAGILANDPALAAKIVRVANSPLYAQRRRIDSLRQAVAFLGLNGVMTLGLSFSLAASLQASDGLGDYLDRFWRRSLLSALACRLLGEELGMRSLEELFLAGLLQDIGILALVTVLPARYRPVAARARSHVELVRLEEEAFGTDHSEAGAWLMQHWRLPDYLRSAALASHGLTPDVPADIRGFMACVATSGQLADLYVDGPAAESTNEVFSFAAQWIGLSQARLRAVQARLVETLPEIESLFQIRLMSAEQARGITDQAQELLATHSLKLVESSTQNKDRAQKLEQERAWLQEAANRDPLTGLYNRRHFESAIEQEFASASLLGSPLSVGFLDVDLFKAVNDSYGHQVGDAVLVAVAETIAAQLRQGDQVVRYGGEEFVVLLPGVDLSVALKVFERIRAAVAALEHPLADGGSLRVTLCAGVATLQGGEAGMKTPEELIRAADRALYLAKRQGRNLVQTVMDESTGVEHR